MQPSVLSKSLHQRLNSYALAASAAGVSLLGLTSLTEIAVPTAAVASLFSLAESAEAKIAYTPAHKMLSCGTSSDSLWLSMNHKRADFDIKCFQAGHNGWLSVVPLNKKNEVWTTNSTGKGPWAAALRKGKTIQSNAKFQKVDRIDMYWCTYNTCYGPWQNVTGQYLGLKFYIKSEVHYGWARFNVGNGQYPTLTGYAYETIPNKPIIAGKTKGPDVVTMQPASLGHLARGASAIPAWRTKP